MSLIDFILNLAGLTLWLNWRTLPFDPLSTATPATLIGTLRRADPASHKRWHFAAALIALLLLRAGFYRLLGPTLEWTGTINLIATRLAFRSDSLTLMLWYSILSFGMLLGVFVLWLLLLSVVSPGSGGRPLFLRLERAHLGFVSGWPVWCKLVLPWVVGLSLWWLGSWPLARWGLISQPGSEKVRLVQAALVGLSTYFAWKYLIAALLTAYLLHTYLYFGRHAMWNFVDETARRLLGPLRRLPLRLGKVDFAPVVGIAAVFLMAQVAEHGLRSATRVDLDGRLEQPDFEIPGLRQLYEHVSR